MLSVHQMHSVCAVTYTRVGICKYHHPLLQQRGYGYVDTIHEHHVSYGAQESRTRNREFAKNAEC